MKKNTIALILVVVLGAITIWLMKRNGNSTVPQDLRDFAYSDTAAITKIFLADKANHQVTLEKVKPGEWKLEGKWKARNDGIVNLLSVVKNLSVRSMVGVQAQENVIKNLASGAIKIEIYVGNKLVKMYYVGGATPDDLGTYMLLADPETKQNSKRPFVMCIEGQNRYLTPVYNTSVTEWRDRSIIVCNPPDIQSIKLENLAAPWNSFEVKQVENNKFKVVSLQNGKDFPNMDTLAVKQYLSYFQSVNFEAFLDTKPARKDSIIHSTPLYVMTITEKNKQPNQIRMFGMEPSPDNMDENGHLTKFNLDHMYALMNNGELVSIQFFVFGKLLPDIEYFARPAKDVKK